MNCHPEKLVERWIITEENLQALVNTTHNATCFIDVAKSGTCVLTLEVSEFTDLPGQPTERKRSVLKRNLKKISPDIRNSLTEEEIHAINAAERAQRRKEFRERKKNGAALKSQC